MRLPADDIRRAIPLAGKRLDIGGRTVRVGVPEIRPLRAARHLFSRFVTIKGFADSPDEFAEACTRQLDALAVREARMSVDKRRVMDVKGYIIVGFSVRLSGLNEGDSVLVQDRGLGGKRKMGAVDLRTDSSQACLRCLLFRCSSRSPVLPPRAKPLRSPTIAWKWRIARQRLSRRQAPGLRRFSGWTMRTRSDSNLSSESLRSYTTWGRPELHSKPRCTRRRARSTRSDTRRFRSPCAWIRRGLDAGSAERFLTLLVGRPCSLR